MLDLMKAEVSVKPANDAFDSASTPLAKIRVGALVTRVEWDEGTRVCRMNTPCDRSDSHGRLNQLKTLQDSSCSLPTPSDP